jgi:hypothetical protein
VAVSIADSGTSRALTSRSAEPLGEATKKFKQKISGAVGDLSVQSGRDSLNSGPNSVRRVPTSCVSFLGTSD